MSNQRESLNKSLEDRFASQKSGGAYDAKKAGVDLANNMSDEFADGFTKGGINTKLPKKESTFVKGLDTRKYKG